MTGREKILDAFTTDGAPENGVVSCYDNIFVRDHWFALTEVPWQFAFSGEAEREVAWGMDYAGRSGLEWLTVEPCPSRAERSRQHFEQREDGIWRVNEETGEAEQLLEPTPSGTNTSCADSIHVDLDSLPATQKEVDMLIPESTVFDRELFFAEGRHDAAVAIREALDVLLYSYISSPLWSLYDFLGYEGMMVFLLQDRLLVSHAVERILRNTIQRIRMISALGADAVWIEECLTDQISPELYRNLNLPFMRQCVEEIRLLGMKSIYYYCGNPNDRLEDILSVGADAIHFEESKKAFTIDIADIVRKVEQRCVVFGNLDAVDVLQKGSELRLRSEIRRQLTAGKHNGNRFVMSTGSPITPKTPVERVRQYTDLAREISMQ